MPSYKDSTTTASDRAHHAAVALKERLVARGMDVTVAMKLADAARARIHVNGMTNRVIVTDKAGAPLATGGQDPIEFLSGVLFTGAPLALQKGLTEAEAEEMTADGSIFSELKAREAQVTEAAMAEKFTVPGSMYSQI